MVAEQTGNLQFLCILEMQLKSKSKENLDYGNRSYQYAQPYEGNFVNQEFLSEEISMDSIL